MGNLYAFCINNCYTSVLLSVVTYMFLGASFVILSGKYQNYYHEYF